MTHPQLAGSSVQLRPLEEADAPLLATWLADPQVTESLFAGPAGGGEGFLAQVAASQADVNLGIALLGGPLVGVVGLSSVDERAHSASLALLLGDKSVWGRGIGREAAELMIGHAFGALGFERLWLRVAPGNARALRLYARLGFARSGGAGAGEPVVMELRRRDWRGGRADP